MPPNRDWVRAVMLPVLGCAAAVGLVFGIWFRCQFSDAIVTSWQDLFGILVDGALVGAVVCLAPAWFVLWVIWLIRQLRG